GVSSEIIATQQREQLTQFVPFLCEAYPVKTYQRCRMPLYRVRLPADLYLGHVDRQCHRSVSREHRPRNSQRTFAHK
ncbi:MAG: hypothetical protein ACPHF4_11465, partial [Rubripirellula sp.]